MSRTCLARRSSSVFCVACRLVLCLVNGIISEQAHLLATLVYSGAAGALDVSRFVPNLDLLS